MWAFHGEADNVIPVVRSTELVTQLQKAGDTQAKLTVYPGVGHDSWSPTYDNPEFYEWLLGNRRGDSAPR